MKKIEVIFPTNIYYNDLDKPLYAAGVKYLIDNDPILIEKWRKRGGIFSHEVRGDVITPHADTVPETLEEAAPEGIEENLEETSDSVKEEVKPSKNKSKNKSKFEKKDDTDLLS